MSIVTGHVRFGVRVPCQLLIVGNGGKGREMAVFQVKETHLSVDQLSSAMMALYRNGDTLQDAAAVTIAAQFQRPEGSDSAGSVMAALASGCEVDTDELIADIDRMLSEEYDEHDEDPHAFLGALRDWAETAPCVSCRRRPAAEGMFGVECVDCAVK